MEPPDEERYVTECVRLFLTGVCVGTIIALLGFASGQRTVFDIGLISGLVLTTLSIIFYGIVKVRKNA